MPLIVTLVIKHGGRLGDQVGGENGQQIGVTGRLIGERVREGGPDRAGLASDQKVDVGDLISVADKGLTDVHDDVAGHGVILRDWKQSLEGMIRLADTAARTDRSSARP